MNKRIAKDKLMRIEMYELLERELPGWQEFSQMERSALMSAAVMGYYKAEDDMQAAQEITLEWHRDDLEAN